MGRCAAAGRGPWRSGRRASSSGASGSGSRKGGRGWRWDGCSNRTRWGRGLATEGARAALDYAFGILRADHVISVINPGNARSIRVPEKIASVRARAQPRRHPRPDLRDPACGRELR
ncbi:MAG: GNAT family N-acetyltransferase [Actinomycetota bacterium]|nr:GNAT family N-acetyltransferase [Actinomycetota bacterium]